MSTKMCKIANKMRYFDRRVFRCFFDKKSELGQNQEKFQNETSVNAHCVSRSAGKHRQLLFYCEM